MRFISITHYQHDLQTHVKWPELWHDRQETSQKKAAACLTIGRKGGEDQERGISWLANRALSAGNWG